MLSCVPHPLYQMSTGSRWKWHTRWCLDILDLWTFSFGDCQASGAVGWQTVQYATCCSSMQQTCSNSIWFV